MIRLELWLGNATITIDGEAKKFENKRLKDLAREPVKMRHNKRGWVIKLGADPEARHVKIQINGQSYEDLPEYENLKGIFKSSVENNWKGNVK